MPGLPKGLWGGFEVVKLVGFAGDGTLEIGADAAGVPNIDDWVDCAPNGWLLPAEDGLLPKTWFAAGAGAPKGLVIG